MSGEHDGGYLRPRARERQRESAGVEYLLLVRAINGEEEKAREELTDVLSCLL